MAFGPGTKVGPYEIESVVGAGGMGQVYRARDTRLDRVVAIKILSSEVNRAPRCVNASSARRARLPR
jgi:eukaryotic-like serine/threonine-protein kinase